MFNRVTLIGNLGNDPEVKVFDSGDKVANFTMATSENYKDKNGEKQTKTEWHNIKVWGNIVAVVEKYLKKGSKVFVEGKITTRSYDKDGEKRYVTEINLQNLKMLDTPRSHDSDDQQQHSSPSEQEPQSNSHTFDDSDDLPF